MNKEPDDIANWKKCTMTYDKKQNIVYFDVPESNFNPKYLDYLLEYYKIPKTAKRVFASDYIPWENPEIVNDLAEELIECSTYGFKKEVCGKAAECLVYLMNKYLKQE